MYQEIWPEAFIQLQREMNYHPSLLVSISKIPQAPGTNDNIGRILAGVCNYCGISIDHVFKDDEELEVLCDLLLGKLQLIDGRTRAQRDGVRLQ